MMCLNPYCSGRWSRSHDEFNKRVEKYVLILIVVDNSLVHADSCEYVAHHDQS